MASRLAAPGSLSACQRGTMQAGDATVQEDGSFQMSTDDTFDGAKAGDYVVTINWRNEEPGEGETIVGPDRLGEQYSTLQSSKLRPTVTPRRERRPPF